MHSNGQLSNPLRARGITMAMSIFTGSSMHFFCKFVHLLEGFFNQSYFLGESCVDIVKVSKAFI